MSDKDTDPPHGAADEHKGPKRRPGDRRSHNRRAPDPPHGAADEWQGPERRRRDRRTHNRRASDAQQSGLPKTQDELQQLIRQIVVEQKMKAVPQKPKAKPGDQAGQPPAATPTAERLRLSNKQIVAAAAVLVALVAAPVAWILWPRNAEIPDGMVGLWTTADPRYADRAFRVTKTTLTFHVGPQDSTYHDIVRVRAKKGDITTQFTVYYTHSGLELEFPLLYVERSDTTIQLLNQRGMTWRKQES